MKTTLYIDTKPLERAAAIAGQPTPLPLPRSLGTVSNTPPEDGRKVTVIPIPMPMPFETLAQTLNGIQGIIRTVGASGGVVGLELETMDAPAA